MFYFYEHLLGMKKDCTLIATLPSLNNLNKVIEIFKNPYISEVRFNTGVSIPTPIDTTLELLKQLSIDYNKTLWIDIKGRQLRISKWADPLYSCIELNHYIEVSYPAKVYFRNGDNCNITNVSKNKLFVDPLPKHALGAGQSVNIITNSLIVDGYLTEQDKQYLTLCKKMNITNIMASFVESFDDLSEILKIIPQANVVSKIESLKGIDFISKYNVPNIMAARDDLFIECEQSYKIFTYLKTIIEKDKNAICASRIFSSLENKETVDMSDFADLTLMYHLGYRRFMLCDNICNYAFDKAIQGWEEFING